MTELEEFSRLLNAAYDAAIESGRWSSVSRQIADMFGTHSCTIQIRSNGETVVLGCTANVSPALMQEYQDHYHATDIRAEGAIAKGLDRAYIGAELVPNALLTRSEHFDFLRKAEMYFVVGGGVSVSPHEIGMIGVQASHNAAEFDGNDRRKMALLLPHLQRAFQLRSTFMRHAIERDMGLAAMDRLSIAVILTDQTSKVLFANRAAQSLFEKADGLVETNRHLSTDSSATTQTLLRFVQLACNRENLERLSPLSGALTLQRARHTPLSVIVAPVNAGDLSAITDRPMAMVLVRDTQHANASTPEILQQLFMLTRAEARLASELADGRSLEEIATSKVVSLNTVRSQLKSLLNKTGTQRQGELVALVHRHVIDIATSD
ncbi:helix-turn-helix transcriptional regulator [Paraburkholderia flagellata]|uniref:helix-turn-helix transcriptional regulator n=1 Tax=Paraburkholderia flagellata TaxID=2883241 RepID=UPI001F1DD771|nr:helix-turn-helix transcriptional regulator [Paraburkholderia flagellata]